MITENNYSKKAMSEMVALLPRGTKKRIADRLRIPESKVSNTMYGKQYNEAIINEIEFEYEILISKIKSL